MPVFQATSREEWEVAASASFVPLSVERAARRLTASVDHRILDEDVSVSVVSANSGGLIRRTSRLIDDSPQQRVIFTVQLNGCGEVVQYGRRAVLSAGDGAFVATDRPYTLGFPQANKELEITMSRARLGIRSERLRPLTAVPMGAEDPGLRVMTAYATSLFDLPETAYSPSEKAMFGQVTIDIVSGLLGKMDGCSGWSSNSAEAHLSQAKQVIARHISDPDLDVSALAALLNVSARTVHTAFALVGTTPARYIRQERLGLAARRMLATRAPLADVAYDAGFTDTTTFTRSFKRAYGMTPSEWRRSRRA